MRQVIIQNSQSRWFLDATNAWTQDRSRARDFGNSLSAIAHCLQNHITQAQVVITFDSPTEHIVIVPVSEGEGGFPPSSRGEPKPPPWRP